MQLCEQNSIHLEDLLEHSVLSNGGNSGDVGELLNILDEDGLELTYGQYTRNYRLAIYIPFYDTSSFSLPGWNRRTVEAVAINSPYYGDTIVSRILSGDVWETNQTHYLADSISAVSFFSSPRWLIDFEEIDPNFPAARGCQCGWGGGCRRAKFFQDCGRGWCIFKDCPYVD
jgi:hypothetical protein